MPVTTRSASGATTRAAAKKAEITDTSAPSRPVQQAAASTKRKADTAPKASRKKTKPAATADTTGELEHNETATVPKTIRPVLSKNNGDAPALVPAVLTFSFEDAKQHLIATDPRFEDVFRRLRCKPFEHLERIDPFRTLVNSIMGQQISWLAARSITHKFVRLFDPSLPETPTDHSDSASFFPTASQVAGMDITTLRSAGLSGRKAEYVLDLAARFADGRLSTEKLLAAEDEELYEMLTAVYGIGRWPVDMFAIFSLRRPDILPVGDLGVQRGVVRWFLSLHAPTTHPLIISPAKLPKNPEEEAGNKSKSDDVLPTIAEDRAAGSQNQPRALTPDLSSVPPAPSALAETPFQKTSNSDEGNEMVLPTPFTPSINTTLNMIATSSNFTPPPLPEGMTPGVLKNRLQGKKAKGVLLTPKEMEELTASWRPYRSLGVFYMWALAEPPK
ncbi:hypothetical protein FOMPIDRAFT_85468 [Fomitopsis schrenkii]|uniref:HhH-GPD domain-containing protein n=1 Tax=Fomitopsis schrenkii TaxID=2126942 RepID=S8EPF1_FOMSC|nr:hypothetical protein FOMPIDRAFT_85468 [Fomitopsis schrenkii]